jgi:hypothetical protein
MLTKLVFVFMYLKLFYLLLAQLSEDVDLSGLEVLEEDQRSIRSHRIEVERQAKLMLTQGLQNQNLSQVSYKC